MMQLVAAVGVVQALSSHLALVHLPWQKSENNLVVSFSFSNDKLIARE